MLVLDVIFVAKTGRGELEAQGIMLVGQRRLRRARGSRSHRYWCRRCGLAACTATKDQRVCLDGGNSADKRMNLGRRSLNAARYMLENALLSRKPEYTTALGIGKEHAEVRTSCQRRGHDVAIIGPAVQPINSFIGKDPDITIRSRFNVDHRPVIGRKQLINS